MKRAVKNSSNAENFFVGKGSETLHAVGGKRICKSARKMDVSFLTPPSNLAFLLQFSNFPGNRKCCSCGGMFEQMSHNI
jgi:hypothetical protein